MFRTVCLLLCLSLLVTYLLTWAVAPNHALSLNAYDWAEWLSLHPTERTASPLLLSSLLIRLHLLIFTVLWTTVLPPRWHSLALLGVLPLILAQLPPLEFLSALNDPNYQQQAGLALLSLVLAGISRWRIWQKYWLQWVLLGAIIGIFSLLWGTNLGIERMAQYNLNVYYGLGRDLSLWLYSLLGIFALLRLVYQRQLLINQKGSLVGYLPVSS